MKKPISLVMILLLLAGFSGCGVSGALKDKTVVESVGIDFGGGEYTVTALTYKPQSPDSTDEQKTETVSATAPSLGEAFALLSKVSGKQPFYDNNRIAVISQSAVGRMDEIISLFVRDSDMREDCYLLYSETDAKQIFSVGELSTADNNRIFTLLQKSVESGAVAALTAADAATFRQFGLGDVYMPVITSNEDKILIENTVVFKNDIPALSLDTQMGGAVLLLRNELSRPVVTFTQGEKTAAVRILDANTKISAKKGSELEFDIKTSVQCSVTDSTELTNGEVSKAAKSYFENMSQKLLTMTALNEGIDAVGLVKSLRRANPELYKNIAQSRADHLKTAKFNVTAEIEIIRNGRTSD